jgi:HEAT repeats
MNTRWRIVLVLLVAAVLSGTGWWMFRPRDALLQGKRESEWIKSIVYNGDDAQTQRWRELGLDGLRLLARTLDRGRFYRRTYRWIMPRLPRFLNRAVYRWLPNPADSHATRMCVIALLSRLGKDARPVEPAIGRALSDDDDGVRLSALGCYESGLLELIGKKEKAARLPAFLQAMQDREWAMRNNAAVALWFYQDQAPVVVPVLVKALQDPDVHVRMLAAKALVHIDAQTAIQAGVVPVLVGVLKDPNDQVAWEAGPVLGDLGKEARWAEPALIESARGTNALVAHAAAMALKRIDPEAAAKAVVK